MNRWQKLESKVDKNFLKIGILQKLENYDKNAKFDPEKRVATNRYRFILTYDPIAEAEEARKNAETMRKIEAMNREREERKQAERETSVKYDDVKTKNIKQETDARQRAIKKKKDELEMGMG